MKLRRALTGVVMTALLGLLVAVPLGRQRQLSIDLWLIAVSVWLAWKIVTQLIATAPVLPARLRGAWQWRRKARAGPDTRPRQLQALEGLVLSARDNDRAHALRLRPRLTEMSDHYLRTNHGVDRSQDPARAEAILGDSAWLVDEQSDTRRPSLAEIDGLLDILLSSDELQGLSSRDELQELSSSDEPQELSSSDALSEGDHV